MTTTITEAPSSKMNFFVLRVASNKEDQVREKLSRKVKIEGLEDKVGRILVPTERVRSMKGGVRKESDRKLYPGYVFVELELDEDVTRGELSVGLLAHAALHGADALGGDEDPADVLLQAFDLDLSGQLLLATNNWQLATDLRQ